MKKNYINPRTEVFNMIVESLLAESTMERANGGGGNNAEVKRDRNSNEFTNPVNWDE